MPTFPIWTPDGVPAAPAWAPLDNTGWGLPQVPAWLGDGPTAASLLTDDFGQFLADDFGNHFINS